MWVMHRIQWVGRRDEHWGVINLRLPVVLLFYMQLDTAITRGALTHIYIHLGGNLSRSLDSNVCRCRKNTLALESKHFLEILVVRKEESQNAIDVPIYFRSYSGLWTSRRSCVQVFASLTFNALCVYSFRVSAFRACLLRWSEINDEISFSVISMCLLVA